MKPHMREVPSLPSGAGDPVEAFSVQSMAGASERSENVESRQNLSERSRERLNTSVSFPLEGLDLRPFCTAPFSVLDSPKSA